MYEKRTDLAVEAREIYSESEKTEDIPGVESESETVDGVLVTRVRIVNEDGERAVGKKQGTYVTLESEALGANDPDMAEKITRVLSSELSKFLGDCKDKTVLVAGLGNSRITPDSIGPKTVSGVVVTRHLFSVMPCDFCASLAPVCAVAPGVLGITGIETGEIIKGISQRVAPDIIIAVDALASRRAERVSTTVQITDSGISPGSGVGNRRSAIDRETLGVPVIAIGVPMVVDAATIAIDTIDAVMEALPERSDTDKDSILAKILSDKQTIVTPKDIDAISERVSKILANGINFALHKDITPEDISVFVG